LRRFTLTEYKKYRKKGLKLYKGKKYAQAIRFCDKKIKIDPNWAGGHYLKGLCFVSLKKYSEAIFLFDKYLDIATKKGCPIVVRTQYSKGWALYQLGNYNEALSCYNKALYGLTMGDSVTSLKEMSDAMRIVLTEKIRALRKLVEKEIEILG